MFKKTTLKNNLRIITVPLENTQAVTILVLVKTGSKYETKQINGISHFLEHMFFKGTKKRPSAFKISEPLDCVGGQKNAFTGQEYTGYWAKVDSRHLNLALDWISDIYLNSLLSSKEIIKEKGVIIEEINMYLDDPMIYVSTLWDRLLYGDQPAGWDITGTKENVNTITRKTLLDYLKNHYSSQNTIVCLTGNIDEKSSIKKIQTYFKGINTIAPKSKLKVIEKQNSVQTLIHHKKTDQTHLCLGARGYNIFHPQKYAQDILAAILGSSAIWTSRLKTIITDRKGLAYYIRTHSDTNTDTGYIVTQTGVSHKNVEQVIQLILKEYKKISQNRVEAKEIQKIKDNIKGRMALCLETSDDQAIFYGMQELLENNILTPEQIYNKIDKVTAEDIQNVARDIFQPKNLNLALIGPYNNDKMFKQLLKNF